VNGKAVVPRPEQGDHHFSEEARLRVYLTILMLIDPTASLTNCVTALNATKRVSSIIQKGEDNIMRQFLEKSYEPVGTLCLYLVADQSGGALP
jgi:hypothetical protein